VKFSAAACLAALLMSSCGSGHKSSKAPAGEETSKPAPVSHASDEPAGQQGQMEPDELAVIHIAQVINIMRDLMHDCPAAERKSLAYIERNKEAIMGGVAYGQKKEKALKGQDQGQYEDRMEALLNKHAPDFDKVLESFGNACPDQKHAIGSAMGL
jgi:hypothetical protein